MKISVPSSLGFAIIFFALSSPSSAADLLFEETFDSQKDWTSGMPVNDLDGDGIPDRIQDSRGGYTLPEGWYSVRQDPNWAASVGYSGGHENIEILKSNVSKARGASGKSMVVWRDSTEEPTWRWNSDGILSKYFPEGYEQLYISFWIRFDPNWTPSGEGGQTKIFRVSSWDEVPGTIYQGFSSGHNAPIVLWDYAYSEYGIRNQLAFRADPQESNYFFTNPAPTNLPRNLNNGDMSLNFQGHIRDLDGDGVKDNEVDELLSQISSDPIGQDSDPVPHDALWGTEWHHIEFFVKMNSGPGNMDGVFQQWIDGQLVFSNKSMPWMGNESPGNRKWNVVHFGGNSHFHAYPDSDRRQEWYSIDDIAIYDSIPQKSNGDAEDKAAPSPPTGIKAQ